MNVIIADNPSVLVGADEIDFTFSAAIAQKDIDTIANVVQRTGGYCIDHGCMPVSATITVTFSRAHISPVGGA